ncbi:MAG: hypothetical protein ACLP2Y_03025 [Limisphaerales bacterium]
MRFEVEPAGVEIRDGLGQNQRGGHGLNHFSSAFHEMAGWPFRFEIEPASARRVPGLVVD